MEGRSLLRTHLRPQKLSLQGQLSLATQVLDRRRHGEFIAGATESTQSQPRQFQNAFQVREQHFDFLALATRALVGNRGGYSPGHIARRFVNAALR